MDNSTVIRKIDDLGRFVVPIDVRKKLNIMPGDWLEMQVNKDNIQIKKASSIQNLVWLANIIIKKLYEIYNISTALEDNAEIIVSTKQENIDEYKFPIMLGSNELGNFVVYDYKDSYKKIVEFVVSIFQKYLEEQG